MVLGCVRVLSGCGADAVQSLQGQFGRCVLMGKSVCARQAVTHYSDPKVLAEVSCGLGEAMVGIDCRDKNFSSYAARSE